MAAWALALQSEISSLFVSEGDDGVVAGGAEGGVDSAGSGAEDGKENRAENPLIGDGDLKGGDRLLQDGFGEEREADADEAADESQHEGFADKQFRDTHPREAERFQDADFARALEHEGVHVQENHEKTDDDADADHCLDKWF